MFDFPPDSYDLALLYLKQCNYDLEEAMGVYKEDEKWEKEHPFHKSLEGKTEVRQSPRGRISGSFVNINAQSS